ncbi:hypothetical protein Ae201684P_013799 [Aphanomyces euteiches]|nr:hypothetical protein Ae201684P_013799 [Aphanomyces euteiches]
MGMSKLQHGKDDQDNEAVVFNPDAYSVVSSWISKSALNEEDDAAPRSQKPLYSKSQPLKINSSRPRSSKKNMNQKSTRARPTPGEKTKDHERPSAAAGNTPLAARATETKEQEEKQEAIVASHTRVSTLV